MSQKSQRHVGQRTWGLIGALVVAIGVTACAANGAPAADGPGAATTPGTSALDESTVLIVGTFALEDTENAVSADQATALLPLWKAQRLLDQSDSPAPAEEQALVAQIAETMTEAQSATIAALGLAHEDVAALMEAQGLNVQEGTAAGTDTSEGANEGAGAELMAGAPPMEAGGEFAGGAMPAMGGDASGGGSAVAAAGAGGNGEALVDAIIALLEAKI